MSTGRIIMVTDAAGSPTQRVEYAPFGELFLDKRQGDTWHTPYLFNAKEYDEETGLYYYGARYYDPHLSLWLSPDRYQYKYPDISTYSYSRGNPVNVIDINGDSTVVVVSGLGQKVGNYIMYGVNVYQNMSLEKYENLSSSDMLPSPDYKTSLSRDAHDTEQGREKKIVVHSEKRYGPNNECPPGTYYLFPKGNSGGTYDLYIGDEYGKRVIHGPDGDRSGIAIHQYNPDESQGCLTTCSGKDIAPVRALIKAIPDLGNPKEPVRIIILPREVKQEDYKNPANGPIKYTGVEYIWNGGSLNEIIIVP